MSRGLGVVQTSILRYMRSAWYGEQGRLVSDIFSELRLYHKDASISRALAGLVKKGLLVRGGEFVFMSERYESIMETEQLESDIANGLPWWCRKKYVES